MATVNRMDLRAKSNDLRRQHPDSKCPECGGFAYVAGTPKRLRWFKCENCGCRYKRERPEAEDDPAGEQIESDPTAK